MRAETICHAIVTNAEPQHLTRFYKISAIAFKLRSHRSSDRSTSSKTSVAIMIAPLRKLNVECPPLLSDKSSSSGCGVARSGSARRCRNTKTSCSAASDGLAIICFCSRRGARRTSRCCGRAEKSANGSAVDVRDKRLARSAARLRHRARRGAGAGDRGERAGAVPHASRRRRHGRDLRDARLSDGVPLGPPLVGVYVGGGRHAVQSGRHDLPLDRRRHRGARHHSRCQRARRSIFRSSPSIRAPRNCWASPSSDLQWCRLSELPLGSPSPGIRDRLIAGIGSGQFDQFEFAFRARQSAKSI